MKLPPRRIFVLFAAMGLFPAVATVLAAHEPFPYAAVVRVEYGDSGGPVSMRDEIEFAVLDELYDRDCFRALAQAASDHLPSRGLLVRVTLNDYRDLAEYETTLAEKSSGRLPPDTARGHVAVVEVEVVWEVLTLPDGKRVRGDRFRQQVRWRRSMIYEDARGYARREAVRELARRVARGVCKGSVGRFRRAVEAARAPSR